MVNRSISDINLRNKYNLNLITIKRQTEEQLNGSMEIVEHILGVPSSDTVILESDTIILFGMAHDIERFLQINI
jgi:trk system potassium uptake protein TrkA